MAYLLSETGSLMAYLLYPDSTGMLGELYGFISSFRQLPENFQRASRELHPNWLYSCVEPINPAPGRASFIHKNAFGYTGRTSAGRIRIDPVFESTGREFNVSVSSPMRTMFRGSNQC
jgi:hypothetical protein